MTEHMDLPAGLVHQCGYGMLGDASDEANDQIIGEPQCIANMLPSSSGEIDRIGRGEGEADGQAHTRNTDA